MLRKWLSVLGIPALVVAGVMMCASPASAQRFGRFGLGWGGWGGNGLGYSGFGLGLGNGYGYYPGYSSWYGSNAYYPNSWRSNWGYSPYSYSWNQPMYSSSWNYPGNYYYGFEPSFYYSGTNTVANSDLMQHPGQQSTSFYSEDQRFNRMFNDRNIPQTAALFDVTVPPNAQVWFENHQTQSQGHFRQFVTPALDNNQLYYYHIRARWNMNGQTVDRTQKVLVHPGDRTHIDFTPNMTVVAEMTPAHFRGQSTSGYEGNMQQGNQFNRGESIPAPGNQPNVNIYNNNQNPLPETTNQGNLNNTAPATGNQGNLNNTAPATTNQGNLNNVPTTPRNQNLPNTTGNQIPR